MFFEKLNISLMKQKTFQKDKPENCIIMWFYAEIEIGSIIILFHIISALTDLLPTSHHVEGECMCGVALEGGECSACHPGHFTPWRRGPSIHSLGGQVGPRASLDIL